MTITENYSLIDQYLSLNNFIFVIFHIEEYVMTFLKGS